MVFAQIPSNNYIYAILILLSFYMLNVFFKNGVFTPSIFCKTFRMLSLHDHVQDHLYSNRCNNFGSMMAFGYFQFLKTAAMQELKERLLAYEDAESIPDQILKHLLIIIPKYGDLGKLKRISRARNLQPFKRDTGGTKDRKCHQAICKSTNKKYGKKRTYFLLDVPNCLLTLSRLRKNIGFVDALNTDAIQRITSQFLTVLSYLLETDICCKKICRIKYYDDLLDDSPLDSILEANFSLRAEESLMRQMISENLGYALAVQYYWSFLSRVLVAFPSNVEKWQKRHNQRLYPKMIVAIPYSFTTPTVYNAWFDEEALSPDLPLSFTEHTEDVGLFEDFPYQQSVYRLKRNMVYQYFTVVSPNTDHISEMIKSYHWKESVVPETRQEFVVELRRLLAEYTPNYASVCDVIAYDDNRGEKMSSLVTGLISDHLTATT